MMNGNEHAGTPGLTEMAGTWVTPRVDVLGVGVSAIDMPMTLHLIDQWISQGDRQYICVTDVHAIMESQRDPRIRNAHNCSGAHHSGWDAAGLGRPSRRGLPDEPSLRTRPDARRLPAGERPGLLSFFTVADWAWPTGSPGTCSSCTRS